MTHPDMHSPSAEFRDRLEWEVTHTLRREQRLTLDGRASRRRRMQVAAVILAALMLGASAGLGSAQIRDAARRDSLLEAARADLALAAIRLNLARAELEDARRRAQIGSADAAALAVADVQHRSMQAHARRAQLNVEEIRESAQPPRDDLNAPLVSGRDFVAERLQLDLLVAQQRLAAAEQAHGDAERRERLGAAGPIPRLEAATEVARARALLATLGDRLALRREFLQDGTAVEQLMRRQQRSELRHELLVTQSALALARERVALVERGRAVGNAAELDVLRAQVELREREAELQSLTARLRRLEQAGQ